MTNLQPADLLPVVQGDVLLGGIPKKAERFLFFQIVTPRDFCTKLKAAVTAGLLATGSDVQAFRKQMKPSTVLPGAFANISFTFAGLQTMSPVLKADLGLTTLSNSSHVAFTGGMKNGLSTLADNSDFWIDQLKSNNFHGLILVAGSDRNSVSAQANKVTSMFDKAINVLWTENGKVRENAMDGHEHFGFEDGISQPTVTNFDVDNPTIPDKTIGTGANADPKWNTVDQNVFMVQDKSLPLWMQNGSFLVYRKLEQDVKVWNEEMVRIGNAMNITPQLVGAKLFGRWQSGCPVMVSPKGDDVAQAKNNQFDFTATPSKNDDDSVCPIGAHIRKTNPRFGASAKLGRILRRGIPYGDDFVQGKTKDTDRGLQFICYQSSIENGFQFIQNTWATKNSFPGQGAGTDFTVGSVDESGVQLTVAGKTASDPPVKKPVLGRTIFVTSRGGEYFFTPTKTALAGALSEVKPESKL